uniref:Uncharacterized protein n=1 Tax=Oryza punctata TaxID=4537 RepID=A0A0E0MCQ5_ORYPU
MRDAGTPGRRHRLPSLPACHLPPPATVEGRRGAAAYRCQLPSRGGEAPPPTTVEGERCQHHRLALV